MELVIFAVFQCVVRIAAAGIGHISAVAYLAKKMEKMVKKW
jgi:hypothetical protein